MKTFSVEKHIIKGEITACPILADGTKASEPYEVDAEMQAHAVITSLVVCVYDDNLIVAVKDYPVQSDPTKHPIYDDCAECYVVNNNSAEVIDQIKADYPAGEYENMEW